MIDNTGIPLPPEIKQFLFDGWFEEVVRKNPKLPYALKITDVKLLAPIPNPPKIICLAFNYAEHAKEQGLQSPSCSRDVIILGGGVSNVDFLYTEGAMRMHKLD